jgi:hypothetical protein
MYVPVNAAGSGGLYLLSKPCLRTVTPKGDLPEERVLHNNISCMLDIQYFFASIPSLGILGDISSRNVSGKQECRIALLTARTQTTCGRNALVRNFWRRLK